MNFSDIISLQSFKHTIINHNLLINGDCINVLKRIKDKSIDLIFIDPPYNIGKDFGVTKDDCTIYLMCSTQFMPYLDVYIQENYYIVSRIVWVYDSSGVQAKKYFGSLYEPLLMATKDKKAKYTFNHEDILVEAKTGAKRKLIDYRCNPPRPYNTKKVPGNVWNYNRVRYKMKEYTQHPTQKPVLLLERIIKASSNPNDVVLDIFMGSCTAGVVSSMYNRNFIGIELNEDYYEISVDRLNKKKE